MLNIHCQKGTANDARPLDLAQRPNLFQQLSTDLDRTQDQMIFRYVVHTRVLDYLMCGWHIAIPDLGPPHNQYSVGMSWLCNCKMVEPLK